MIVLIHGEFHLFMICFSVTSWLQSEEFDPCILPMGPLAYHLAIRPSTEYSLEGEGLLCRESLPIGLQITHPFNAMHRHQQWSLVYEHLYQMDPNAEFKIIMSVARDPLLLLRELLLRHDDTQLDHKSCLAVKYPM